MASDDAPWIIGPAGTPVENGEALTYVCKYRNRWFFIERQSMNAWYLGLNAVGGQLNLLPLSGAATKGGKLLFCATWSIDAGDGIDDKLVFCTDLGELLIFTGGNPSNATNWRQEGRYEMSPPLGMNAHLAVGGDLLIATVDGILPTSGAITKSRANWIWPRSPATSNRCGATRSNDKREHHWTLCKWDEYGGIFVTLPGGLPGEQRCLVVNRQPARGRGSPAADCMCFMRLGGDMFFGTQTGQIMLADRTGYDNGVPYVATLVGGWEMFSSPSQTITWRQARASFFSRAGEPFQPQLSATTDYVVTCHRSPMPGRIPGLARSWDEGLWDTALWDATAPTPSVRNTMWVSIGMTGYSHAPVVQVTVAQNARPIVDLISIARDVRARRRQRVGECYVNDAIVLGWRHAGRRRWAEYNAYAQQAQNQAYFNNEQAIAQQAQAYNPYANSGGYFGAQPAAYAYAGAAYGRQVTPSSCQPAIALIMSGGIPRRQPKHECYTGWWPAALAATLRACLISPLSCHDTTAPRRMAGVVRRARRHRPRRKPTTWGSSIPARMAGRQ